MEFNNEEYLNLITSQHRNKPKFMRVVEIKTSFYTYMKNLISTFPKIFDVDNAVGVQLDVVGYSVGASRFIETPLTDVFFEWDNENLGWERGIWKDELTPMSGLAVLPDDIYRTLIKAKIAANQWDGTVDEAYKIWDAIFPNNTIIIQDNQNMTIIVAIVGEPLDALTQALLTGGYLPLKPEGVGVEYYAIQVDTNPIFVWDGLGTPGLATAGWDEGSWSQLILPT